jgi:hypothetical protein
MSKIEVNAIEPQCGTTLTVGAAGTTVAVPSNVVKSNALQASDAGNIISQSGTAITLGASGDSINLASGATQSGFGRTGTVDWQTGSIKTGTFVPVSGEGYFVDTSGGVSTANLPAGSAGAIVSFADYTRTFQTNNLTIVPNGSEKVGGVAANFVAQTEGQSITLVYVDATEGWINTSESTGQSGLNPAFITATGGTITTVCTNFKVHTFTGPGTFTVCSVGNPRGSTSVDYMVVAGAGAAGNDNSGGGGGGGFRESSGAASGCYTTSPLGSGVSAITVTAQGYPIVVGAGGATTPTASTRNSGSDSSALGIPSTGGGGGGSDSAQPGLPGGSGGGGNENGSSAGGTGDTPPVSPPQGNTGAAGSAPTNVGGAGGGATVAGSGSTGAVGATTNINGSPTSFAGGGGAGSSPGPGPGAGAGSPCGTGKAGSSTPGCTSAGPRSASSNTGGGGGGSGPSSSHGGAGGSGIVIIRYKFQ